MNREMGLGSHSLSHSSPVPNEPYGFCGRKVTFEEDLNDFRARELAV